MTEIVFFKQNNIIVAYECLGHTGYAEAGEDIVCSALSSIIQSTALGLKEVLELKIDMQRNDDKGYFKVVLPREINEDKSDKAQVLLTTLYLSVKDLAKGYSKYIKLEERDDYVY